MNKGLQPVRGTKDLLGNEARLYDYIIAQSKKVFECYGYEPIYTPIFEFIEVFKRTLGDFSDVVNKEMYSFEDRGGEILTLRPEFTASIARAFISNGLQHQLPLRYYSSGPVFRYERPQLGRQRQFHQINIECLGVSSAKIDGEIIEMASSFLHKLGIADKITLHLNSLGCKDSRRAYLAAIVDYFSKYKNELSEESILRLEKNPLRILDSKSETDQKICQDAPKINDYYTSESQKFFDDVKEYLAIANVKYEINPKLVRGLDYYCHTAFEFVTTELGAQGTVLGGGRYNDLISMLGGPDTPGIGFASGLERLSLLVKMEISQRPNVIIPIGEGKVLEEAIKLTARLRKEGICIIDDYDSQPSKKMKRANKINAKLAIFIGDEELNKNVIKIKDLDSGDETEVKIENVIEKIKQILS